jgi:hypothetical protein
MHILRISEVSGKYVVNQTEVWVNGGGAEEIHTLFNITRAGWW